MTRPLPSGTVTLLFTDIEGSTRLLEQARDAYGGLLAEHRRVLRAVWAAHRGVEVDTQGDAFLVAFADPRDALAAAAGAVRNLAAHAWGGHPPVRVRIGVHTGTPETGEEGYWGPDVHYGARLGAAAHGGQVLVSATTAALVRDGALVALGAHAFKDFPAPAEVHQLVVDGAGPAAFPTPRWLATERHRLPRAAAPLVGRETEVAEVAALLADRSLVTVVGPGGSGKTRLAVEVAHRVADRHEDAWFVLLESVAAHDEVESAVARALGLADSGAEGRVAAYLADRSAVLVLDNLEHVLDAAPLVGAIAAAGPDVRVLVTSQAPLRVAGEQVVRLGPLEDGPALRLLLDRAADAGVALDPEDPVEAGRLRELADRLEGMPLAIELAAPRLAIAGPGGLLRQLDRSLDALGTGRRDLPERQRGLRAVLDWSCGLLGEAERDLLAGLSAFGADVDPEAVEDAFPGAFDGLVTLVDVGLVRRRADRRLALRPPVRRYAAGLVGPERLAEQHRAVVRALADLAGRFEARWLIEAATGHRVLGPEEANILAALEWSRDHDPDGHADLVAAAGWWTTHQNLGRVARGHADLALARTTDPLLRARLLQARGTMALDESDPGPCLAAAEAWAEQDDVVREVLSLAYGANLLVHAGDAPRALEVSERALRLAVEGCPDDRLVWWAAADMHGQSLMAVGRREEARALAAESTAYLDAVGDDDPWRRFFGATFAADLAVVEGDPATALPLYARCIEFIGVVRSLSGQLLQAAGVAECLLALGRAEDGALALALCQHVDRELGHPIPTMLGPYLADLAGRADTALVAGHRTVLRGWTVEAALAEVVRIARSPD
ncbi:adenylate/guanylate cyclase domain-containing protein [Nocardioides sp. SOB77]|uniref:Adenylate/guanylate cyclase domain-containing protein n=1 Tax=Nocardioides oceani TaxID=3058369 RepID=A0ABT8FL81_9ACTN|nr:adenylate/guanylate cyclase domain-containing protein [Nocardioides oceani]MDN4175379.1 adenylate/guanylate cyclase domain-containing protein [Nocardioides oceani]